MKSKQLIGLFGAILLGAVFGLVAPDWAIHGANQFRNLFGACIRLLVPFIIAGFVTSSIAKAGSGAGKLLLTTMGIALASTVLVGFFAYGVSWCALPFVVSVVNEMATGPKTATGGGCLSTLPTIAALLVSIPTGLVIAKMNAHQAAGVVEKFKTLVSKCISLTIAPLMPIYIFTVVAEMTAAGEVVRLGADCLKIMCVGVLTTIAVMLMLYMMAGVVTGCNPLKALANMLPAYLAGCGSCSSVASIPYTLRQVRENGVSGQTAELVIPLCSSVHHVGGVANLIVYAAGVMILQGGSLSAHAFIPFVLLVALISFVTPGIPGGVAMASASVAGSYLGFTSEQYAIIVAIYIALDGIGTACNLTCDGAVAMIVEKLLGPTRRVVTRDPISFSCDVRAGVRIERMAA